MIVGPLAAAASCRIAPAAWASADWRTAAAGEIAAAPFPAASAEASSELVVPFAANAYNQ